ncbi:MAG: hypothetical protein JXB24_01250 [Bacteroidales bacterium]|jgi:hypothetical protein|nr:hypothetical protein [Bacteroidales bacterium]
MKHLFFLTVLFCFAITNAQQQKDVVYLKNGSIIKGTITEMNPGSNLKIKTADGSLFVFEMNEIEKVIKETVTEPGDEKTTASPEPSEKDTELTPESKTTKTSYSQRNTELGKVHLGFQPAGFLQFGPVIELGFRVGNTFVMGPHFRYTALGLAYNAVNDFENTLVCFSLGFSFKHFPAAQQKNKFYYGAGLEYEYGESDDYDDWYGSHAGVVILTNAGYRWRFGSGFYINLGVYAGAVINIYDEWYDYDDEDLHDDSGWTQFSGYAEFGIGVEF